MPDINYSGVCFRLGSHQSRGAYIGWTAAHGQALATVADVGSDDGLDLRQLPLRTLIKALVHLDGTNACDQKNGSYQAAASRAS